MSQEICDIVTEINTFACSVCGNKLRNKSSLKKHMKNVHKMEKEMLQYNDDQDNIVPEINTFACSLCGNKLRNKSTLRRHMKNVHKIKKEIIQHDDDRLTRCLECSIGYRNVSELRCHLESTHYWKFVTEFHKFQTELDFDKWLESVEISDSSKYIRKTASSIKTNIFNCHLSGRKAGKRGKKLGHMCTSQVLAKKTAKNKVIVTYHKTHYGHGADVFNLRIGLDVRKEIADKLASGITVDTILKNYQRDSGTDVKRSNFITRKDVDNIAKSCSVRLREGARHEDETASLSMWVEECSRQPSNPVAFYKPLGSCDRNFAAEDVVLILLNHHRLEFLSKFMSKYVAVNGSLSSAPESDKFNVTILITTDDWEESLPAAFLLTNRNDNVVMEFFFKCVKDRLGPILTQLFVSGKSGFFFKAWRRVMGPIHTKLTCRWEVDKLWKTKLKSLIRGVEQRKAVHQALEIIRKTNDPILMHKRLENFSNLIEEDSGTEKFAEYFKMVFLKDPSDWAECYRRCGLIDPDSHMNMMDKFINSIRRQGNKLLRMDKALFSVLMLLRDVAVEQTLKFPTSTYYAYRHLIQSNHNSISSTPLDVHAQERNTWIVVSDSQEYTVKRNLGHTCCRLMCIECNVCVGCMSCSCTEFLLNMTICVHIHYVIVSKTWNPPHRDVEIHVPTDNDIMTMDNIMTEVNKLRSTDFKKISDSTLLRKILESLVTLHETIANRPIPEGEQPVVRKKRPVSELVGIESSKRQRGTKLDEAACAAIENFLDGDKVMVSDNPSLDHSYV